MELTGMKTECGNYIIESIVDVGPTILDVDIKEEPVNSDAYIPEEETHNHTNTKVNGVMEGSLSASENDEEFNDGDKNKTNNNSSTFNSDKTRPTINTVSKTIEKNNKADKACLLCRKPKSKGHKCTDLEERPYMCSACNKTYLTSKALASHKKRSCSGSRNGYTCHQCNRIFYSLSGLTTHSKVHCDRDTMIKPSASSTIQESSSADSNNTIPVGKRAGVKKNCYVCDICNKSFSIKYALTIHKMIHSSEMKEVKVKIKVENSDSEKSETIEKDFIDKNELENKQESATGIVQDQKHQILEELEENPLVIDEEDKKPIVIGGFQLQEKPSLIGGFNEKLVSIGQFEKKSVPVDKSNSSENNQVTSKHSKILQLLQQRTKSFHTDDKGIFYLTVPTSQPKSNKTYSQVSSLDAVTEITKNGDCFDEKCMYICELCKMGFYSYPLYQQHMHSHTQVKVFLCAECGKTFLSQATLANHIKIHYDGPKFKCTVCDLELSSLSKLTHHKVTVHMDRVYECDICGKGFFRSWHLKEHRANHTVDEAKECDVCGTHFSEIGSLRKHMWSHLKEARLGVKGAITASKGVQNLQARAGYQSFGCDQCSKVYHSRNRLTLHKRTHSREKISKCNLCGKDFFSPSELNRHQRTHTGEKPFQCGECGKSFALATTLKDHIRSHTGEKPFKCFMCSKSYSSSSILGRHKLTHIGQRKFQCNMCDKSFLYNTSLQVHKRTHTGEKPFHCEICDKSFTMLCHYRVHSRIHTGERPYQCTYCNKNFNNYGSHYKHIRKHPEFEENNTAETSEEMNTVISMIETHNMESEQIEQIC